MRTLMLAVLAVLLIIMSLTVYSDEELIVMWADTPIGFIIEDSPLPEGEYFNANIGFRSDGIVVWREAK
jgi:hypothetical protein